MQLRHETTIDMTVRAFTLRGDSIDEAARTCDAILATEDATTVFDMRTWEPVDEVLRMDGYEGGDQCVLLDSHPQVRNIGNSLTTEDVRGSIRQIRTAGDQMLGRLNFAGDDTSLRTWEKVRDKHVRDMSVGSIPLEQTEIPPGRTATVRGKSYTAGPRKLLITTRWRLGEGSVTPRGADTRAKIRQAATAGRQKPLEKENPMNETLRAFLESVGLVKGADETTATAFRAGLTGANKVEADKLAAPAASGTVNRSEVTPSPAAPATPAAGFTLTHEGQLTAEALRSAGVASERHRVARIHELAGSEISAELVRSAVDGGWDESRAAAEFLGHIRQRPAAASSGPAIHAHGTEKDCTLRALATGFMLRTGTMVVNPRANEAVRAQQERDAEQGSRYRDMTMLEMCREALRLDGRSAPHTRDELVRDAVSSASLTAIFTTNVSARLLERYLEITDTTVDWCRESDVANFKSNERFYLGKAATPERLERGGEAKHATIADNVESYKIARYAKQFVVDEQDIIDDNFNALQEMPDEMGAACGRLRPNLVYAILLSNPNLADGNALFSSAHNNYVTGTSTALSATSLAAGVVAMAKQTQDGVTLNIAPQFLIVPQDTRFTAQTLLRSAEVRDTTASTKYTTYNALQDLTLVPRADNRIGVAGVTDPVTGTAYAGLATNWFLSAAATQAKTIEVGYLAGTGRRPQIRPFTLTQGRWGIGWDVKLDIGAKALDFRGLYMATGAA